MPPILLVPIGVAAAVGALHYGSRRGNWKLRAGAPAAIDASGLTSSEAPRQLRPRAVTMAKGAYRGLRNVLDRTVALIALLVLSPVMAGIALIVRLDSPGPALFRQRRIGIGGTPFTMVKFRTLQTTAPPFSLKLPEQHSSVTRVGRFLRRSGLDELPQLWNVVTGEMALIGPRPEQIELIDLYQPWQRQRESIRPGITGWWQIHHRDGIPLHLNVEKDLYYVEHQGPWIDLLIVLGTLAIVASSLYNAFRPAISVRPATQTFPLEVGGGQPLGVGALDEMPTLAD